MKFVEKTVLSFFFVLSLLSCAQSGPQEDASPALTVEHEKTKQETDALTVGIDVSHHCNEIDFGKVKAHGVHFVFCKATEGDDWTDPNFLRYFSDLKTHQIRRGAYHFYIVGDDPIVQANHFIQTVQLETGDLPPVVDIESMHQHPDPKLAQELKSFLDILENHYQMRPILYTGERFWNKHLHGGFSEYPLWIAEYGVEEPQVPQGWTSWAFWQKEQDYRIPGIEKEVDFNIFSGNLTAFDLFIQDLAKDQ